MKAMASAMAIEPKLGPMEQGQADGNSIRSTV